MSGPRASVNSLGPTPLFRACRNGSPSVATSFIQGDNLMKSLIKLSLLTILISVIGVPSAFSQASSSTAELRGQVTDSVGAAVPNATVTVTDTSKGTTRTATTDAEGNYVF